MYLEEIILDGFKSYATRTVISNFDSKFNAITGLNGSGKSNILDAICFVLGITNLSQVSSFLFFYISFYYIHISYLFYRSESRIYKNSFINKDKQELLKLLLLLFSIIVNQIKVLLDMNNMIGLQ